MVTVVVDAAWVFHSMDSSNPSSTSSLDLIWQMLLAVHQESTGALQPQPVIKKKIYLISMELDAQGFLIIFYSCICADFVNLKVYRLNLTDRMSVCVFGA